MSEQNVIGYGTSFTALFFDYRATLRVVSPINKAAPVVNVTIYYAEGGYTYKVVLDGNFFENLLAILADIKQHTDLLSGAEFGFLGSTDHQAILFTEVGPATVKVFRKKGILSGAKDIAQITIENLVIERDLDDEFLSPLQKG